MFHLVFFGHLTPAVEELRYQHTYVSTSRGGEASRVIDSSPQHPVPVEEKSPALAAVLNAISAGQFGDASVYEP